MSDNSKAESVGTTRPKIVFERTYRARREELWELWTTKEGFESWWGPRASALRSTPSTRKRRQGCAGTSTATAPGGISGRPGGGPRGRQHGGQGV